jgi:hypothetical protein
MSADALRREPFPEPEDQSSEEPKAGSTRTNTRKRLWVNTEFLRNLTRREPQIVIQDSNTPEENYYVKLADIALRAEDASPNAETDQPEVNAEESKTKPKGKGSSA